MRSPTGAAPATASSPARGCAVCRGRPPRAPAGGGGPPTRAPTAAAARVGGGGGGAHRRVSSEVARGHVSRGFRRSLLRFLNRLGYR